MNDTVKVRKPFCLDCAKLEVKVTKLELEIFLLNKDLENRDHEIETMRKELELTGRLFEENDIPCGVLSYYIQKDERSKGCLQVV